MQVYGTSIFCDDIRNEIDDKVSLIGCYGPVLALPQEPPFILPKLGIHVIVVKEELAGIENLKIQVFFPGPDGVDVKVVDAEPDFPPDASNPPQAKEGAAVSFTKIIQDIVISPVEITAPGIIRVIVQFNGQEIRAGALRILSPGQDAPIRLEATGVKKIK